MTYNGKVVIAGEDFSFSTVKVGDYVEQEVVDYAMDIMPPACMASYCSQIGEPYSHKIDPLTGNLRATYATFKKVGKGVWEYCGHCFRAENKERGEEPPYVKGWY